MGECHHPSSLFKYIAGNVPLDAAGLEAILLFDIAGADAVLRGGLEWSTSSVVRTTVNKNNNHRGRF